MTDGAGLRSHGARRRLRRDGAGLMGALERFHAELDAARFRLWRAGAHDCLAFAVRCAEAYLGRAVAYDPSAHGSWAGRAAILRQRGSLRGVVLCLADAEGWPEVPILKAPTASIAVAQIQDLQGGRRDGVPVCGVIDRGLIIAQRREAGRAGEVAPRAGWRRVPLTALINPVAFQLPVADSLGED